MSKTRAKVDFEADHLFANLNDNAIDSLSRAVAFASDSDSWRWKWIAFSLHHSLYTFCLAALHNGDWKELIIIKRSGHPDKGVKVWRGQSLSGRVSRIERIGDTPAYRIRWNRIEEAVPEGIGVGERGEEKIWPSESKVIGFWTALARVLDGYHYMARYVDSKPLVLSDDEILSIVWLSERVRNNLMHFVPHHNWIHIQSISETAAVYVRSIEFLAFETHMILLDKERSTRIQNALDQLRNHL